MENSSIEVAVLAGELDSDSGIFVVRVDEVRREDIHQLLIGKSRSLQEGRYLNAAERRRPGDLVQAPEIPRITHRIRGDAGYDLALDLGQPERFGGDGQGGRFQKFGRR